MRKFIFAIGFIVSATYMKAADLEVDGISYDVNLETMEATVVAGDYAFRDIIIPEKFDYNGRTFTVTKIGSYAFYDPETSSNPPCYVTELVIPKTVKVIEEKAISNTKYLKKLVIPNSVEKVGDWNTFLAKDSIIIEDGDDLIQLTTYKNCKFGHFNTDYLYIGRDIKGSGGNNYDGLVGSICRVLEYGDNVKRTCVMEYNFGNNDYSVTKLIETIILGENIEPMFYGRNLETLKEIYSKSKNPRGFEDLYGYFTNSQYMNLNLYVPQGCKDKYMETVGWNKFFLIEEYETISGIQNVKIDEDNSTIWDLNGRMIKRGEMDKSQLPRGVYILKGKKILVK